MHYRSYRRNVPHKKTDGGWRIVPPLLRAVSLSSVSRRAEEPELRSWDS